MRKGYKRHSDEDIVFWAEVYTELGLTLEEIEQELAISHSTAFWCFIHRLPYIDSTLHDKVIQKMNINRHHYKVV